MCEQRKREAGKHRHRLAQVMFGDVLELFDAGRTQEALEAQDPGPRERLERFGIAGTTPPQNATST